MRPPQPRPYRVYVRSLGTLKYVGCYVTFELASLSARANGGFVTVRKAVWTDSAADSLSTPQATDRIPQEKQKGNV